MKLFLQNVHVISPGSSHHLTEKDILIEDGKISVIETPGKITSENAQVVNCNKLYVSSGWFDLHANFAEPGNEAIEDVDSGCAAAIQGGFSGVLLMPSTEPPVSGRPAIEYLLSRSKNLPVDVFPAGSLSENCEGKELSEMYDMFRAGAKVFTDDKKSVRDAGLMTRALLYSKSFGGKIFSFPEDTSLARNGVMNEGSVSKSLGLKGIPSISEELIISRDISLSEYTETPIHFSTISTRRGVDLIRKAKARGLKITADVAASYLLLDDTAVNGFDSIYKVKPPFRTNDDRLALIEGLADGTIDCICSDHIPQSVENKRKEYALAEYGATGLETAFGVARKATDKIISLPELVSRFTIHPRSCAGIKTSLIEKNQPANLTIFDPEIIWTAEQKHIKSKSKNNPFVGTTLKGKAIAVINKNSITFCI